LESRLTAYVEKAIREAKARTSWVNPNTAYETACRRFIQALFEEQEFLADLTAFHEPIARTGLINSLSQTLLKMTIPGVPDFYQGSELIDLNLVDPDNRRPVDYALRKKTLKSLDGDPGEVAQRLMAEPLGGAAKLWVIRQGLAHRRDHAGLYYDGSYDPLRVTGPKRRHAIAFTRADQVIVVAPRLVHQLSAGDPPVGDVWEDTHLQLSNRWSRRTLRNVFTGERLSPQRTGPGARLNLRDALRCFPVALLSVD
jgi:(1->4)-alpha-D-glucan 1-alpha-D-glucosylmutase